MQVPVDSIVPVVVKKYLPLPPKTAKPSLVPHYQKKHQKAKYDAGVILYKKQATARGNHTAKIVTEGTLVPANFNGSYAISHNKRSEDFFYHFIIIVVFCLFAYLTYLRRAFSKYFLQISGSVVNLQLSGRLFRDSSALFEKVDYQLNVFFILISGIFIVFSLKTAGIINEGIGDLRLLLLSTGFMAAYTVFRFLVIKITGFFMMRHNEFDEYLHNAFIYFKVLGIILLPITLFMIFLPDAYKTYPLYAGLGVVTIMFIMRILRCFRLIVSKGMQLFYAILYLCTIEILPILLVGKYAMSFAK